MLTSEQWKGPSEPSDERHLGRLFAPVLGFFAILMLCLAAFFCTLTPKLFRSIDTDSVASFPSHNGEDAVDLGLMSGGYSLMLG